MNDILYKNTWFCFLLESPKSGNKTIDCHKNHCVQFLETWKPCNEKVEGNELRCDGNCIVNRSHRQSASCHAPIFRDKYRDAVLLWLFSNLWHYKYIYRVKFFARKTRCTDFLTDPKLYSWEIIYFFPIFWKNWTLANVPKVHWNSSRFIWFASEVGRTDQLSILSSFHLCTLQKNIKLPFSLTQMFRDQMWLFKLSWTTKLSKNVSKALQIDLERYKFSGGGEYFQVPSRLDIFCVSRSLIRIKRPTIMAFLISLIPNEALRKPGQLIWCGHRSFRRFGEYF